MAALGTSSCGIVKRDQKKFYIGDIGTKLVLDIDPNDENQITSSDVIVAKIIATKPRGTSVEWPATPSGHTIYRIIEESDITQPGVWYVQAYVELSSGWKGYGTKVPLLVSKR